MIINSAVEYVTVAHNQKACLLGDINCLLFLHSVHGPVITTFESDVIGNTNNPAGLKQCFHLQ